MDVPDYADPRPAYLQIADHLRAQIRTRHRTGDQLPSNKAMAKTYAVAPETIRDALRVLRDEGVIVTHSTRGTFVQRIPGADEPPDPFKALEARVASLEGQVADIEAHLGAPRTAEEPMTDVNAPLRPAIVAAIITSKKGVLIERRHDGRPLHTFPAGEAEPGESPADTAIRETKEETGLLIKVSHLIGERVHPKTGRRMIYLACRPYQGTGVHNGDEAELAEVRWVGLPEAEELLVGMYEPVHDHLKQTLSNGH